MKYWIGDEGQLCDDEIQNIIDVTILEDLNTGDLEVWKGLGDYWGEGFNKKSSRDDLFFLLLFAYVVINE